MQDNQTLESPPEVQFAGVSRWLKENLFSSISSSILTVLSIAAVVSVFRAIIGFFISPEREWTAVTYNLQLYMVQAYPESDFIRVWITVGLLIFLLGLSWGFNSLKEKVIIKEWCDGLLKGISSFLFIVLIAPTSVDVEGTTVEVFSNNTRYICLAVGIGLILTVYLLRKTYPKNEVVRDRISFLYLSLLVGSIWIIKVPTVTFTSSNERVDPDPFLPLANTTTIPWTIIFGFMIFAYLTGSFLKTKGKNSMSRLILSSWVLAPLVIVSWIYRKPDFGMSNILTLDIPIAAAFSILGILAIRTLSSEKIVPYQRYITYGMLVLSVVMFFLPVLRQLKILFFITWLLVSVAPTIANSKESAKNLSIVWSVTVFILILLMRGASSESLIVVPGSSIYGGFTLTWLIAFFGIAISFPFGVILALGRTSKLPVIRIICTAIIELVRSVPFITWLFFGSVMLTLFLPKGVEFDEVLRAIVVTAIFSSAYLAENVRGGLQSISNGQFEAADAVGLSTLQRITLIIMPQALRAVIPPIVSQVISLFKDTSLVAIVGLFDLLYIGSKVIPNQSQGANFLGTIQENILFCAIFYWIFTYSFARRSMKIEKRLGLGER
ncbi:amino acid ABC transporter permease [Acidimicrobiia bacterium]|jgi:general L-amino acid transport system permease protein|nr:amino acid ABC transporter permease [Acidimicrobiia bacterium]MDA8552650.1 amino acid ABC transporter permease [bacterium]MDA8564502.1 amino acid ABC transporter permease [bacterium]MDA8923168.1 amino acid ABC transporter permease [Acidimicrobiia bacterium]MDA9017592.1 amino acid ABC transporter permease [Acidimicrobiia bacterium]